MFIRLCTLYRAPQRRQRSPCPTIGHSFRRRRRRRRCHGDWLRGFPRAAGASLRIRRIRDRRLRWLLVPSLHNAMMIDVMFRKRPMRRHEGAGVRAGGWVGRWEGGIGASGDRADRTRYDRKSRPD